MLPEIPDPKDIEDQKSLTPYVHPNTSIQFYAEGEEDVITLISSDGYAFKVQKPILTVNSLFWKDILSFPAKNEPITLPESAETVYAVLYLIHELEIDISGHDEKIASESYGPENAQGWTPLDYARQDWARHLNNLCDLVRKWQLKPGHRLILRSYINSLTDLWKQDFSIFDVFVLACKEEWLDIAKRCLIGFEDGMVWTDGEEELNEQEWEDAAGLPFLMDKGERERLGTEPFARLVRATALALSVNESDKIHVDWKVVSRKFTFDTFLKPEVEDSA